MVPPFVSLLFEEIGGEKSDGERKQRHDSLASNLVFVCGIPRAQIKECRHTSGDI